MYKIPINKLSHSEKERLFSAMGKTKKGRKQLSDYEEIKEMGLYSIGSNYMMSKEDYSEHLNAYLDLPSTLI